MLLQTCVYPTRLILFHIRRAFLENMTTCLAMIFLYIYIGEMLLRYLPDYSNTRNRCVISIQCVSQKRTYETVSEINVFRRIQAKFGKNIFAAVLLLSAFDPCTGVGHLPLHQCRSLTAALVSVTYRYTGVGHLPLH